jgi:hypothetical protein
MMHIRRVFTVTAAVAALAAATPVLVAQQQQQQQQQNNQQNRREQEKRSQQEQRDIEALVTLVDAVSAGKQPAPADIPVTWQSNHFVKGSEGGTYIPFTLTLDATKLANPGVALYLRAVDKAAAPAPAAQPQPQNNNNRNQQAQGPVYPWDDINFIQVPADGKVQRALMLKPGEYDLYIAVKERTPQQQQRNAPPQKSGVLKHTLKVPDYNSTAELTISTPILAKDVMPLTAPLSLEDQRAKPYTFGGTLQITPAEQPVFKTAEDFQLLFWIYGVQDKGGVPDVSIEYNFHVKNADGTEKFFNKTQPQVLNSTTLPPGFSVQAGHQVLGFLGVPLKSFPAGDYRVEYKITDKISGKTLTQNTTFTVQA